MLFFQWLKLFDCYVSQTCGRKVLLFADKASCHGFSTTLPTFTHVRVEFLPANTTFLCQPLDAGIIASVKKIFKRLQLHQALDVSVEEDTSRLYKIDLLTAIEWMRDIWSETDSEIIRNCWRKTGLLPFPALG